MRFPIFWEAKGKTTKISPFVNSFPGQVISEIQVKSQGRPEYSVLFVHLTWLRPKRSTDGGSVHGPRKPSQ